MFGGESLENFFGKFDSFLVSTGDDDVWEESKKGGIKLERLLMFLGFVRR
jgi:hypothetical protein